MDKQRDGVGVVAEKNAGEEEDHPQRWGMILPRGWFHQRLPENRKHGGFGEETTNITIFKYR